MGVPDLAGVCLGGYPPGTKPMSVRGVRIISAIPGAAVQRAVAHVRRFDIASVIAERADGLVIDSCRHGCASNGRAV